MADPTSSAATDSGQYSKPIKTKRVPRVGKSFTSRNPTPIGAIGLVFLIVLVYAAFNATKLPLIGGGTQYTAYFTEAAGLKSGDDVRIAGVKVGEVQGVGLSGAKVKVTFTVKDGWVGNQSTIDIKLKTLLGAKLLDVNSIGTKSQDSHQAIPIKTASGQVRTTSPFDVYPAFTALTDTVQQINTPDLTKAFQVLATDFSDTPSSVKPLVTGLSRLSTTIASRNSQLQTLLSSAQAVTGTLASRDADLQKLLTDGNLLLGELNSRRAAINSLLVNTQLLATQLNGLVSDNQKTLGPLLDNLNEVLGLLEKNRDSLDRGLSLLGPFYRVFNNVLGNGRWFDNYIQNLSVTGVLGLTGLVGG
jgi:phospholipid/cholesterol/gamma-HCH transport system substrate-binding protein